MNSQEEKIMCNLEAAHSYCVEAYNLARSCGSEHCSKIKEIVDLFEYVFEDQQLD